jgi:dTDP-4-amino-4,6-dideoxygalactose transaminase
MQFVGLNKYHNSIKKEINSVIEEVINESAFIGSNGNRFVKEFEIKFENFIGAANCIGCANGTDAIEIALVALGIGEGDEVLVPAVSWYSTAEAVANIGAKPVFVDVNKADCNMDVSEIDTLITEKTRAIIPVHLYGNAANIGAIMELAEKHELLVIEDCAQAHGAKFNGQTVGSFGDAATFSFYPGKNLGAFGDAGAMIFKDAKVAKVARQIRNHGQEEKHTHVRLGRNSRMDGLHAGVLSLKLRDINEQTERRVAVAKRYDSLLNDSVVKPKVGDRMESVFHLYVIQVENRDGLIEKLRAKKIPFGIHYPVPLPHLAPFNRVGGFDNANYVSSRILSLPIHPFLTEEEVQLVANEVNQHHNC